MKFFTRTALLMERINLPVLMAAMVFVAPLTEWIDVDAVNITKSFTWIILLCVAMITILSGHLVNHYTGIVRRLFLRPDNIPLFILLLFIIVSCFNNPYDNRIFGLKMLIVFFSSCFFVFLSNVRFEKKHIVVFFKTLIFVGTLVIIVAYVQLAMGIMTFFKQSQGRMTSIFWDPNIFARYFVCVNLLCVCLLFFYRAHLKKWQIYYLIGFIVSSIIPFYLSYSRSGMLILPVGLVTAFLFYVKRKRTIIYVIIAALGISYLGFTFLKQGERFKKEKSLFIDYSNLNRTLLLIGAIKVIKDNLVFGIGYDNFEEAYNKKYQPPLARALPKGNKVIVVHNTFLMIWSEAGMLAVLAYLVWTFIVIRKGVKTHTEDSLLKMFKAWTVSCYVIFFTFGILYFSYLVEPIFWLIAYLTKVSYSMGHQEENYLLTSAATTK